MQRSLILLTTLLGGCASSPFPPPSPLPGVGTITFPSELSWSPPSKDRHTVEGRDLQAALVVARAELPPREGAPRCEGRRLEDYRFHVLHREGVAYVSMQSSPMSCTPSHFDGGAYYAVDEEGRLLARTYDGGPGTPRGPRAASAPDEAPTPPPGTSPQVGDASGPADYTQPFLPQLELQHARYDGWALSGRLLVKAGPGGMRLDKRLFAEMSLVVHSLTDCATGKPVGYFIFDVFTSEEPEELLLEPGTWFGKEIHLPLFVEAPLGRGPGPACIEVELGLLALRGPEGLRGPEARTRLRVEASPGASTQAPAPAHFSVDEKAVQPVVLRAGDTLDVRLEVFMSSGANWRLAAPLPEHLVLLSTDLYAAEGPLRPPGFVGGAQVQVFHFRALRPGASLLEFVRGRPWEGQAPDKSFLLRVAPPGE